MAVFKSAILLILVIEICSANRAFPMQTQNYVIDLFQKINPKIDWDPTNYLIDLVGQSTNCAIVGTRGYFEVNSKHTNGKSIGGLKDYHAGNKPYAEDVHEYLVAGLKDWISDPQMRPSIEAAEIFGCSVRPLCKGYVAFACLFSPSVQGGGGDDPDPLPNAQAFTPEQYMMAEMITRQSWDRAHTLENLSGLDADCAMINNNALFLNAKKYAKSHDMQLDYLYGSAENKGETQPAMEIILKDLTPSIMKINPHKVGCSLIPDCMFRRKMFVVVSCILE